MANHEKLSKCDHSKSHNEKVVKIIMSYNMQDIKAQFAVGGIQDLYQTKTTFRNKNHILYLQ